jgi:hypothetical protein
MSVPAILAGYGSMRAFIRCTLAAIEHEEDIDKRWEGEDQQRPLEPSPSTLIDGALGGMNAMHARPTARPMAARKCTYRGNQKCVLPQ